MTPNSPVVYTTCETVLGKFTGCEVVFTAGKNAALYSHKVIYLWPSTYMQDKREIPSIVNEKIEIKC